MLARIDRRVVRDDAGAGRDVAQRGAREIAQPPRGFIVRVVGVLAGRGGRCGRGKLKERREIADTGEHRGARGRALSHERDVALELDARLHAHRLAERRHVAVARGAQDVLAGREREGVPAGAVALRRRERRAHGDDHDAADGAADVVADDATDMTAHGGRLLGHRRGRASTLLSEHARRDQQTGQQRDRDRNVPGHTPSREAPRVSASFGRQA